MTEVLCVVEGKTEHEFVASLLAPHLRECSVYIKPVLIGTGPRRGGGVSVRSLGSRMASMSRSGSIVTSFVDLYGFGGRKGLPADELELLVSRDVRKRARSSSENVKPFAIVHEFEALLLSDVEAFSVIRGVTPRMIKHLRWLMRGYKSPEEINDGYHTTPSRRILGIFPAFIKHIHGPDIAATIGLRKIREMCPRFNQWLTWLENPFSEPSW